MIPLTEQIELAWQAQDAIPESTGAMTRAEIADAILKGAIIPIVIRRASGSLVFLLQTDSEETLIAGPLWWNGNEREGVGACRECIREFHRICRERGVRRVFGSVHVNHPRRDKLLKFYERFGFKPDVIRLAAEV